MIANENVYADVHGTGNGQGQRAISLSDLAASGRRQWHDRVDPAENEPWFYSGSGSVSVSGSVLIDSLHSIPIPIPIPTPRKSKFDKTRATYDKLLVEQEEQVIGFLDNGPGDRAEAEQAP